MCDLHKCLLIVLIGLVRDSAKICSHPEYNDVKKILILVDLLYFQYDLGHSIVFLYSIIYCQQTEKRISFFTGRRLSRSNFHRLNELFFWVT